ncbi:hypothetical protein D3C80_1601150 [compost metagenome]
MHHGQFHGTNLQDLRAERCHFKHFLKRDLLHTTRLRLNARVCSINAIDVGIDIAAIRLDGGGDCNSRRIGAATAQRCNTIIRANTLETGDDSNLPLAHATDDIRTIDIQNTGSAVSVICADRNLPTLPGTGIDAQRLQSDGQKA